MFLKAPRALDSSDYGYYAPIRHLRGKFQRHMYVCMYVIVRPNPKITTPVSHLKTELRSGQTTLTTPPEVEA